MHLPKTIVLVQKVPCLVKPFLFLWILEISSEVSGNSTIMYMRLAQVFLQFVRSLYSNTRESEALDCLAGVLPSSKEQLLPLLQQISSYLSLRVCLRRWMTLESWNPRAPGLTSFQRYRTSHLLFMFQMQTNSQSPYPTYLPDGILCSNHHTVVLLTPQPSSRHLRTVPYAREPGHTIQLSFLPSFALTLPSQFFLMGSTVKAFAHTSLLFTLPPKCWRGFPCIPSPMAKSAFISCKCCITNSLNTGGCFLTWWPHYAE